MPYFLAKYSELAEEDEECYEPGQRMHNLDIAEELIRNTSPIVARHLFKFELNRDELPVEELCSEEFKSALVYCYQRAMAKVLNISPEMREFTCVVLETETWFQKNISCFALELRFPYCHVDRNIQKTVLKTAVIQELRREHILAKLPTQPIGDWDQIIQDQLNILPMYRSSIDPSHPPHSLSDTYGIMSSIDDVRAKIELSSFFNPNDHTYILSQEIDASFLEDYSDNLDKWIPILLSAYFWNKVTSAKKPKELEVKQPEYDYDDMAEFDSLVVARILLPMLGANVIGADYYWQDIGRVLHNITNGSDEGLELLCSVSVDVKMLQGGVRTREMCKKAWPKFAKSNLTIKTLAFMARSVNAIEYNQWHSSWVKLAVDITLEGEMTDVDMAELVYRYFWLEFMCSDIEKNKWWYFTPDNHRLIPMDKAVKLRTGMTNQIVNFLCGLRQEMGNRQLLLGNSRSDEAGRKNLESKIGMITALIRKFKMVASRDKIVAMCKELFYVENFSKKINKGGLCTAWPNCVIEICGNDAVPRPGKPEDFITKCGLVPYSVNFSFEHPLVKELLEYLGQVFPDEALLHYALKDFASYLKGKNSEKMFRVWTGEGNNSKSMLVKLMQLWFGERCIDLPVSIYTGIKMAGSGPNPELAQAECSHLAITAEPDDGTDLKSGCIKRGTGGDRFFARGCNQDGGSIDLLYKAIYMCNSIPNIPNVDKATKNRFGILPFLSVWSENAPDDPEEQMRQRTFKMNVFFEERLPDLAEAMFWLAVQMFPIYMQEGLSPPPIIVQYTQEHWAEHDPYDAFSNERMKKVKFSDGDLNDNNSVSASDLYPQFKTFFRAQYPHSDIPSAPQFKTQLSQRLGKQVNRRWPGWILKDVV
jgi:hypothetical protein